MTYHLAGTHGPSGVSGDTGNPRDRINGSLTWEHGPLTVTGSAYWIGSYSVLDPSSASQTTCQGAFNAGEALAFQSVTAANEKYCRVKSFTSVNMVVSYAINPKVTVGVTVDNLFDANAPFDAETYGGSFTPYNPSLDEDGVIGRSFLFTLGFKY